MDHTGLWPQLIQNNDDEIKYFSEKIASKYECGNYNQVFNKYCDGKENVFNKDKGPYIRFNKSTLKYLIKFIWNYDKSWPTRFKKYLKATIFCIVAFLEVSRHE